MIHRNDVFTHILVTYDGFHVVGTCCWSHASYGLPKFPKWRFSDSCQEGERPLPVLS